MSSLSAHVAGNRTSRARSLPHPSPRSTFTAVVAVVGLFCLGLGTAFAAGIEIGAVGTVKKVSEDGNSFEIKAKGIPSKTFVFEEKDTRYKAVEVKPFSEFKEGDRLYVLGKKQEGNDRVPASISGILAIASGEFESPLDLPEKQQKVKGLEWIAGSLEKDGKQLKLAGATLTTGGKRPVAVFKSAKRHDAVEAKKQVFVRGKFHKKEKGEKNHRLVAESIFVVDKKVSSKEFPFLFDMSTESKKKR